VNIIFVQVSGSVRIGPHHFRLVASEETRPFFRGFPTEYNPPTAADSAWWRHGSEDRLLPFGIQRCGALRFLLKDSMGTHHHGTLDIACNYQVQQALKLPRADGTHWVHGLTLLRHRNACTHCGHADCMLVCNIAPGSGVAGPLGEGSTVMALMKKHRNKGLWLQDGWQHLCSITHRGMKVVARWQLIQYFGEVHNYHVHRLNGTPFGIPY
jgi:hypothetical protein